MNCFHMNKKFCRRFFNLCMEVIVLVDKVIYEGSCKSNLKLPSAKIASWSDISKNCDGQWNKILILIAMVEFGSCDYWILNLVLESVLKTEEKCYYTVIKIEMKSYTAAVSKIRFSVLCQRNCKPLFESSEKKH